MSDTDDLFDTKSVEEKDDVGKSNGKVVDRKEEDDDSDIFGSDGEKSEEERPAKNKSPLADNLEDSDDDVGGPKGKKDKDEDAEEGSGSDDDKASDEEDEEEERGSSKKRKPKKDRKRKLKSKGKASKKSKKELQGYRFFSDLAEEGDSEEEEIDDREGEEEILDKDNQAAVDAVLRRHERQREFLNKSAEDIAREYEERHQYEEKVKETYEGYELGGSGGAIPIAQQSLLPKITDPKLFKLKCKMGMEQIAVRAVMLKTIDVMRKEGFAKVKSVFYGDVKGYLYVEAVSEAFAKEIINGLKMVYISSLTQIPIPDMPAVLNVTIQKKPMHVGQWVRIRRGPLKGDLARIVELFEGGDRAVFQAIPRPDFSPEHSGMDGKKATALKDSSKVRPPQRLFDAELAKSVSNGNVFRRYHPTLRTDQPFDVYNNKYYKDGFLFEDVITSIWLNDKNVNPRIEELNMFLSASNHQGARGGGNGEGGLDDASEMGGTDVGEETNALNTQTFSQQLTQQIANLEAEAEDSTISFAVGDHVLVIGGELQTLIARIVGLDDLRKTAKLVDLKGDLPGEFEIEWNLLVKHVVVGAHVKVMKGKYTGQTGRVVSVLDVEGTQTAAILTDGLNNEIQCNVSFLQMTSEVATGLGNLMGYELYDLVSLNQTESAVVINVMLETLRVINNNEQVKDISPQQILAKQNTFSSKSKTFDANQHSISVGDVVNVIAGPHKKLTGTIKHIMRGKLWLHSDSYLKHSGIFVVPSRSVTVAGGMAGNIGTPANMQMGMGVTMNRKPDGTPASYQSTPNGGGGTMRLGRDPLVSKTVTITKGAYKGLSGVILGATDTHYNVELLAKLKKVTVPKADVRPEQARELGGYGAGAGAAYGSDVVPSTPYLSAMTPAHLGSETPHFGGGETPGWGSMTPYGGEDNAFRINDADTNSRYDDDQIDLQSRNTTPRLSEAGGDSIYGAQTPAGKAPAGEVEEAVVFIKGMVIMIKKGENMGRLAVIVDGPENADYCFVRFRDGQGRLSGDNLRMDHSKIGLAEAQVKSRVVVLAGKFAMQTGTVTKVVGKDVFIEFDDKPGERIFLKKPKLAWIHNLTADD